MKNLLLATALAIICSATLAAQEEKTHQQREKEFYEAIEGQVNKLTSQLDLEDWQIFYVDSILTHDYKAMQDEFNELQKAKVENSDLFVATQDKWSERIYQAMNKVLRPGQWEKYLKSGAARDKKLRDKRASKK